MEDNDKVHRLRRLWISFPAVSSIKNKYFRAVKPFVEMISTYAPRRGQQGFALRDAGDPKKRHPSLAPVLRAEVWHLRTGIRLLLCEQAGKNRSCLLTSNHQPRFRNQLQRYEGSSQRIVKYFASLEAKFILLLNHKTHAYFKYPLLQARRYLNIDVEKNAKSAYNSYK